MDNRRSPRYEVRPHDQVILPTNASVQVLDISVGGVLLQSNRPMKVGARGTLRFTIDGQSIATDVLVARVNRSNEGAEPRYRIGARFVAMTPEDRNIIERFTN